PFRLLRRQEDLPYPAGAVDFLRDAQEEPDEEAGLAARGLYGTLVKAATDREPEPVELDQMGAYDMAATVEFPPAAKQELLELRSENARMRLLATMLEAAIERLELLERAQARARSNGKVRFA
ncbi:MAG TPA: peptidase S16, partial [Solirubrobacteraceae bacterium]|nr:peptidase S16 [Solirubrobacteraceae bacterium]